METEIVYTKTYPVGERSTLTIEVSRYGSTLLAHPWLDTPGWDRARWSMTTEQMLEALTEALHLTDVSIEKVTCVDCYGRRYLASFPYGSLSLNCVRCNGTGEMLLIEMSQYQIGRAAALKRRDRRETQRAMCERLNVAGLSMVELSKIEAGRWAGIEQQLIDAVLGTAAGS